jgi:SAM-dependent methyltransferase
MVVHAVAKAGFEDPADYEAARPSYPPEAVAWLRDQLGIGPGKVVCDLAAGTGKLTRLLVPLGAELLAIEPVSGMRTTLHSLLPAVPIAAGTAEALPIAARSIDALTVAQAFHWFDFANAIAEFARVLRPGGGFGLCWNARDRSVDWVDEVWAVMDRVEKRAPWRDHENWRDSARREMPGFGTLQSAEFRHEQVLTADDVVRRVASVSHVAVLPPRERDAVLDKVRTILTTNPATRGRRTVAIPYRVDCYATVRR